MNAAPGVASRASSPSIELEDQLFPLVVTTFGETPMTDDDVRGYCRDLDALAERRGRFVHLIDTTRQKTSASPVQRRIFADWLSDPRAQRLAATRIGDAVVITNALVRGAVTAVFWIRPPVAPTKIFATPRESIAWIEERARDAGITLSPAMRERITRG